ncbi:MAG TPA: hypothetical protein VFI80_06540 [Burkholderiales bacterium]|nr:hypothetical protein [Burkholderiales bacterium]
MKPSLLRALRAAAVLLAAGGFGFARADSGIKHDAVEAGHAVGSAFREIGKAAAKAGKEVGHGAAKVGKDIGHGAAKAGRAVGEAAEEGGHELGRAVRGDKSGK